MVKCKKCKNNFENPGYNPNMDLDLCPDCNLEIEEKIIDKGKLLLINKKFKKLCNEIAWRIKTTDYHETDYIDACVHETIDKEVTFMSISEIKSLSDELGTINLLNIEQDYLDNFGEWNEQRKGIDKLRAILYWYFEKRYYEEVDDDPLTDDLK